MAEDGDYMSDEILNQCVKENETPGLLHNRKLKREHDLHKKKLKMDTKPLKQQELERREEGLNTAISEENKGFQLLQKMGYKPGAGIGKSTVGKETPVEINVKVDNFGLGLRSSVTEKQKEKANKVSSENYRSGIRKKLESRDIKYDYNKSRRMCYEFDIKKGTLEKPPINKWFWPDFAVDTSDEEAEEKYFKEISESEMSDRLEAIIKYLRETYTYCMWCSTTFDDEEDMQTSCPGATRQAHE